jgi:hypothetical protein
MASESRSEVREDKTELSETADIRHYQSTYFGLVLTPYLDFRTRAAALGALAKCRGSMKN